MQPVDSTAINDGLNKYYGTGKKSGTGKYRDTAGALRGY